jgi:HEAT repeat protein
MVDQAEIHRKAVSSKIEERKDAAYQFKYNFAVLPDKEQVWEDLVRLTHDENGDVRWHAIYAIDVAFQHVSDKEHAWKDLHRLTDPMRRQFCAVRCSKCDRCGFSAYS